MKVFYASFILSYCLVSINLFFHLFKGFSYKTFEIHWCKLNHSIRDVNCCKGVQSSSTTTYSGQLLNLFLWTAAIYSGPCTGLIDTPSSDTAGATVGDTIVSTRRSHGDQILAVPQCCHWGKILFCLAGQMSCKNLWCFGSHSCVALSRVCRQGRQT